MTSPACNAMHIPSNVEKAPNLQAEPFDTTTETISVGDKMGLLGDNNPFIEAMAMAGCMEKAGFSPMQIIQEGDEDTGKPYYQPYTYHNGDLPQDTNTMTTTQGS